MHSPDDLRPWERPALPSTFTLADAARRLGHYAWAEIRTFEILGSWSADLEPGAADLAGPLARHGNEHALHAEAWRRRFPELRELDRDAAVVPANDDLAAFFDHLADLSDTADRLVGAYRVLLPHLVATYSFHRNRTSEVSDGPTRRSLRIVLDDDHAQIADGTLMLASVLVDADSIAAAARVHGELETLLVDAGGIVGNR